MLTFIRMLFYSLVVTLFITLVLVPFAMLLEGLISPVFALFGSSIGELSALEYGWLLLLVVAGLFWLGFIKSLLIDGSAVEQFAPGAKRITPDDEVFGFWARKTQDLASKSGLKSVTLFVHDTEVVNAYAVQTPVSNDIILTSALIQNFRDVCGDQQKTFELSVEGILAHEISHLRQGDYLPQWFFLIALRVLAWIQTILATFLLFFGSLFLLIPFVGKLIAFIFQFQVKVVHYGIDFLGNRVLPLIQSFFDAIFMRRVEYRCDLHGAKLAGPAAGYLAQCVLADTGSLARAGLVNDHPPTIGRILQMKKLYENGEKIEYKKPNNFGYGFSKLFFIPSFLVLLSWLSLEKTQLVPTRYFDSLLGYSGEFSQAARDRILSWGIDLPGISSIVNASFGAILRDIRFLLTQAWMGIRWIWSLIPRGFDFLIGAERGFWWGGLSFVLQSFTMYVSLIFIKLAVVFVWEILKNLFVWIPAHMILQGRKRKKDSTNNFLLRYCLQLQDRRSLFTALWHGADPNAPQFGEENCKSALQIAAEQGQRKLYKLMKNL